jgi:hypothetical protein
VPILFHAAATANKPIRDHSQVLDGRRAASNGWRHKPPLQPPEPAKRTPSRRRSSPVHSVKILLTRLTLTQPNDVTLEVDVPPLTVWVGAVPGVL